MIKVICTSLDHLPAQLREDERAFTYFKSARRDGVGTIAKSWHGSLKRKGFRPSPETWDFVQLCLAVCATDLCALRSTSADGWTRTIELSVGLFDPMRWEPWKTELEQLLKVLTGDYWTLTFTNAGLPPPQGRSAAKDQDCVSLLSGGLDSLIGGLDLVAQGRRPLFVSQLAHEDSQRQRDYAQLLGGAGAHYQWSHGISFKGPREPSTRGGRWHFMLSQFWLLLSWVLRALQCSSRRTALSVLIHHWCRAECQASVPGRRIRSSSASCSVSWTVSGFRCNWNCLIDTRPKGR